MNRPSLTKEMVELKAQGKSYADIAAVSGLTRQGVQWRFSPRIATMRLIADRARGLCEKCGQFDQFGHYHHKVYDFDILNEVENILYLCTPCHLKKNGHEHSGHLCLNCGKELSYIRRRRKFCGKGCQIAYNSTTHECSNCHKIFIMDCKQKIRIRRSKSGLIFCSKSCQGKYMSERYGFGVHPEHTLHGKSKYDKLIPEIIMRKNRGESLSSIYRNMNIPKGTYNSYLPRLVKKYIES